MEPFQDRELVIATQHGKEQVLAPLLRTALGVWPRVPAGLNTDQFGAFSGEVARTDDPLTAARRKCELAMDRTGCELAVASEGSFGAHPFIPFVPGNEELVLLVDRRHDLEVFGQEVSTETNFAGQSVGSWDAAEAFATEAGFPEHRLLLRRAEGVTDGMIKGIGNWAELRRLVTTVLRERGAVFLETDMRAMHNPARMRVIAAAAERLVAKLRSCCPACQAPGYSRVEAIAGLPCAECGLPTRSARSYRYACQRCAHTATVARTDKTAEDPMYCDYCNP
jgi:hypothetical protein